MERFFDIVFSSMALLVLSPLLIPVVIVLKMTGENKIFYLQKRIGREDNLFDLYKFATMLEDSPNMGSGTITMKDDPRILPFGKYLRKSKINELPQLLNIFFGDMSIIGPRPLTQQTFGYYDVATQLKIKKVKPGLSGIGSIIFRKEEEIMHGQKASIDFYNNVIAPYKGKLEEWYVSNKNIFMYFSLILLTIWVVFFKNSKAIWHVYKTLPIPPDEIKNFLNYPDND